MYHEVNIEDQVNDPMEEHDINNTCEDECINILIQVTLSLMD